MEKSLGCGMSSNESLNALSLSGFASKTSQTGETGCPQCGSICGDSDKPHCLFSCVPVSSEHTTKGQECLFLPTPTAKANHLAPSMRKWPAYARLQDQFGNNSKILPDLFRVLMGFPNGWLELTETL